MFLNITVFAEVPEHERNALPDFYQSTNGPQWTTQWDVSKPVPHNMAGLSNPKNIGSGGERAFRQVSQTYPVPAQVGTGTNKEQ